MEQTLVEWIDNEMEYEDGITTYAVLHMWTWHDYFYLECDIELTNDGERYYVAVIDQRCGRLVERVYTTKEDLEPMLWEQFHKYNDIETDIIVAEMDEC